VALFSALGSGDAPVGERSLRRRIAYVVVLLLLFRILADIPILNVDEKRLEQLLADNPLIGVVDLFAGGDVLKHFSFVAAGLVPYLMALGIVTATTWTVPALREWQRQGETGKKRIERLATILTIPLAFVFAWAISRYLSLQTGLFPAHIRWFTADSFFPSLWIVSLVTLGSFVSTAISRLITKQNIGSGESVVLLAGSSLVFVKQVIRLVGDSPLTAPDVHRLVFLAVGGVAIFVLSVYLSAGMRQISLVTPKRATPGRSQASYRAALPMRVNSGGVLPIAGAAGLLALLQLAGATLASHFGGAWATVAHALAGWASPDSGTYWLALAILIVMFTYVCNFARLWEPFSSDRATISEYMKMRGDFIAGVRPGVDTEKYLARITALITLPAALGLALLGAGIPYAILVFTEQNILLVVLSLIMLVQTLDDARRRIEAHWTMESYEGLLKRRRKPRPV
jgi:preprotein translocase subunit SecY